MRKFILCFSLALLGIILAACNSNQPSTDTIELGIVYRSPTWGCCSDWIEYMADNGYTFEIKDVDNLSTIKQQYQVPFDLQSCHTAIVDGYIIEGHVPVAEVERLLREKPPILGIAVAGMPANSPGMEIPGAADEPFDVIAFDAAGNQSVYASYNH